MFQIVRLALDDNGEVNARRPLQPLFELREDALAMAEFDASRLSGDYGCDDERDVWWATDARGREYRFVVEPVADADAAARIGGSVSSARRVWKAFEILSSPVVTVRSRRRLASTEDVRIEPKIAVAVD